MKKMKKEVIIGTIFVVALLMAMTFVSAISATPEKSLEQWTQEHTVEVEHTTIYKYEQGYLEIKEIYTGIDLEKKLGVDNLTDVLKIPVEAKVAEEIGLREGEEKIFVTEEEIVVTREDDPPVWWTTYDYPQWTYKISGVNFIRDDPINLVWDNTNKAMVKSEILEEDDWTDNVWEEDRWVYDPGYGYWMLDDPVADSTYGWSGRYHARLWQMSDGAVVSNAHHDDPFPHHADEYEPAESLVASFFNQPGDTDWTVHGNNWWLNNRYTNDYGAYNNGWATRTVYN